MLAFLHDAGVNRDGANTLGAIPGRPVRHIDRTHHGVRAQCETGGASPRFGETTIAALEPYG